MSSDNRKSHEKKIDVKSVVSYLTRSFQKATESRPRALRDKTGVANETYKLESEFSYILDDIERGPECLLTHNIARANEFIDSLSK